VSEERQKHIPLRPPEKGHPDDRARVPLEAAISALPFGGAILKIWNDWFPTQSQRARGKWEGAVTERANEHATRLDEHDQAISPTTELSAPAVTLAVALAREPSNGMGGKLRDLTTICALGPDLARDDVEDAVFEMKELDLVELTSSLNGWWLKLTQKFYEQVDPQVMGWDPLADARDLARLLLDDTSRQRTAILHAASGWDARRFNPAFRALLRYLPVHSKEIQADYPSSSVNLMPEQRGILKRFVSEKS
jgi:hypothetical protein